MCVSISSLNCAHREEKAAEEPWPAGTTCKAEREMASGGQRRKTLGVWEQSPRSSSRGTEPAGNARGGPPATDEAGEAGGERG